MLELTTRVQDHNLCGKWQRLYRPPIARNTEIVPKEPFCRAGQEIELSVLYEEKPLASADIKAVSKKEGRRLDPPERTRMGWQGFPSTWMADACF